MKAAKHESTPALLVWSPLVFALGAFSILWLGFRDFWIDDAFITFRYSQHLVEGFGPVFNPGERVEGYTAFLWMLFTAIPLGLLPEGIALSSIKISGLFFGLLILFRIWTFPGPQGPRRRWLIVLLATYPTFVLNCGDGMETPLFMWLIVECCRSMLRAPDLRSGVLVGLPCAGLVLTRPESLPLLLALPLILVWAHRGSDEAGDREGVRMWLLGFALAGVAPVIAHEAWRWLYYGHPVPNTYYAKATGSQWKRLTKGYWDLYAFFYVSPWVKPVVIWSVLALASVAVFEVVRGGLTTRARLWLSTLGLFVIFRVSFDLWSGGEQMGVDRFIVPVLIPLVILADEGLQLFWRGWWRFALAAMVVVAIFFNLRGHQPIVDMLAPYKQGVAQAHVPLGLWLRENHSRDTLVAIGDAGAVPFFGRTRVIDLWGLNDAAIARLPGEYGFKMQTAENTMQRRPDLVVLQNQRPYHAGEKPGIRGTISFDRAIAKHPGFVRDYRFVEEFVFRESIPGVPGYYLDVFERRQNR